MILINKVEIKTVLDIFGIIFIDVAIFIYFSYAFIIRYDTAIDIAIDTYFILNAKSSTLRNMPSYAKSARHLMSAFI